MNSLIQDFNRVYIPADQNQIINTQTSNIETKSNDLETKEIFNEVEITDLRGIRVKENSNQESHNALAKKSLNKKSNQLKQRKLNQETEKKSKTVNDKFISKQTLNEDKQNQYKNIETKKDLSKQIMTPHQIQRFWSFPQSIDSPMPKSGKEEQNVQQIKMIFQPYQIVIHPTTEEPFDHDHYQHYKLEQTQTESKQQREMSQQDEKSQNKATSNFYYGLINAANSAKQSLAKVIQKLIKDESEEQELSQQYYSRELLKSQITKKQSRQGIIDLGINENKNIEVSIQIPEVTKKVSFDQKDRDHDLHLVLQGEDEAERYVPPKYQYVILA